MKRWLPFLVLGASLWVARASEVIPPRMVVRLLIEAAQKDGDATEAWQYTFDPKRHAALTPLSRAEQLRALKGLRTEELRFDKDEYAVDDRDARFVVSLVAPRVLYFEIERVEHQGEIGPPWGYRVIAIRTTPTPPPAAARDAGRAADAGGKKPDRIPSMGDLVGEYPLDLERSKGLVEHPNILRGVRLVVKPDKSIEWGGGKWNRLELVKDLDADGKAQYALGEGFSSAPLAVTLHADGYLELDRHFFRVRGGPVPAEPVEGDVQAATVAHAWLKAQPQADQYLLGDVSVTETPDEWRVAFRHVDWQRRKPSTGLVAVDKATGQVRWIPQK